MSAGALRETAIRAARIGGEVLLGKRREAGRAIHRKGDRDFVTDADRAAQAAIVAFLRGRHPEDSIRAEEDLEIGAGGKRTWVIDPLDGTTNFIHGYPCFSVSVAVLEGREVLAGAVYDPTRDEMFEAGAGAGARGNGEPLRVSPVRDLDDALLVTGFPFREPQRLEEFLVDFTSLFRRASDIRRDGSAALDLCYVAAGRLDGFWERGLSAWDVAAGSLLVREAGGKVTDLRGGDTHLETGDLLAANAEVHSGMLAILARNPFRRGT
ncbi:MAG: inositol monophosphatase [Acidobacteria bacterium]|nr:inositol monophosphatase [Acidobacteriota bacterium]